MRPFTEIDEVSFGFYSNEEIERISVVQIFNPVSMDQLGKPTEGGLYDKRMGGTEFGEKCHTCHAQMRGCPGHPGHIKLNAPMWNPLNFFGLKKLLAMSCVKCNQLNIDLVTIDVTITILAALDFGLLTDASRLIELSDTKINARIQKIAISLRKKIKYIASGKTKKAEKINPFNLEMDDDEVNESMEENKPTIDDSLKMPRLPAAPVKRPKILSYQDIRTKVVANFLKSATAVKNCPKCQTAQLKWRNDRERTKLFCKFTGRKAVDDELSAMKSLWRSEGYQKWLREKYSEVEDAEFEEAEEEEQTLVQKELLVTPNQVMYHVQKVYENHPQLFQYLYGMVKKENGINVRVASSLTYFCEVIMVSPNRFRPMNMTADKLVPNPQNAYYGEILRANPNLSKVTNVIDSRYITSQTSLNNLFDNKRAKNADTAPPGIFQILEKKEGLFRRNMMGKRVNFAARTVISPDPFLPTNTLGIPLYFAHRLTYPEPVNERNYKEMAQAVINGPFKHPGAKLIESNNGSTVDLSRMSVEEREAAAKLLLTPSDSNEKGYGDTIGKGCNVKKVHRHIRDGDLVLTNRQPTLHKPSIMAHYVKVLETEKTLRMHYANCNSFNADFDGDEMNIHFPQDQISRAEADTIVMADYQYITARNGTPLRGLIQDHVVTGVLLTKRDTFLDKEQFAQIVYSAVLEINSKHPIQIPVPAILKPVPRWTGKQVISTVLKQITVGKPGITHVSKAKIPEGMWGKGSGEGEVTFRQGDLLTGVLDKSAFGASSNGFVHACYELYGPRTAGEVLSCLSRLFTIYLQDVGFSCGMDDLLLQAKADEVRSSLLSKANSIGDSVARKLVEKEIGEKADFSSSIQQILKDDEGRAKLDGMMKQKTHPFTSDIIDHCLPDGQLRRFPHNYLSMMTVSGAKGSAVNFSQISCLLGQQELEGRRVPVMSSGRTLPSFDPFDTSSRAGGYIMDRFLTGIRPQEYFFHCMAGREGLVDTAVKTSRSGYLQRVLVKHLEGLKVGHDSTVRDSDGSVVQFYYGEDGIDVTHSAFLKSFDFMAQNFEILKERHWPQKDSETSKVKEMEMKQASKITKSILKAKSKGKKLPDPVNSQLNPFYNLGASSEAFNEQLNAFVENNPKKFEKIKLRHFKTMAQMKFYHSMAHSGEAVGAIAAQSIGEPSTQMTLNTFHLAGRGDVNVTLGIPRLREILMTGSRNNSTPSMNLPMKEGSTEKDSEDFVKLLYRLKASEIVEDISISESLSEGFIQYKVSIVFFDEKAMKRKSAATFDDLTESLSLQFMPLVERTLKTILKQSTSSIDAIIDGTGEVGAEQEEDDDEPGSAKKKNKKKDKKKKENEDISEAKSDSKRTDIVGYDSDDALEGQKEDEEEEEKDDEETTKKEENSDDEIDDSIPMDVDKPKKGSIQILSGVKHFKNAHFDKKTKTFSFLLEMKASSKKILMMGIFDTCLEKTCVKQVKEVQQAVLVKGNKGQNSIVTSGINLAACWEFQDRFDVNKITCNNPHFMIDAYGIEAGKAVVETEIANVFSVYGIQVDSRHLSLIADFMTKTGQFRGMNRPAIQSSPSVYQKASYESTMDFLTKAAISGDTDRLQSPSASLVLGKVVESGTGGFEVYQPILNYN
eukprot:TRINITY_DN3884_c0_g1_i4.p1 TRINITY_DN3884_c0_g1~~TRINITY_DN3884_c0_g1_i4.p1  ORF type:complete len:1636 (+),score=631.33 TRINITY_DN3884_c0_g1_i4:22-4908(+)